MNNRVTAPLGYSWAALTLLAAAVAPFLLFGVFTRMVAHTGVRVDPVYTGGDVARSVPRAGYRVLVFHPARLHAFQRGEPFVQVAFEPVASLPRHVEEPIDLDGDGHPDVRVTFSVPQDREATMLGEVQALNGRYVSLRLAGADSFSRLLTRVGDRILLRIPMRPSAQ